MRGCKFFRSCVLTVDALYSGVYSGVSRRGRHRSEEMRDMGCCGSLGLDGLDMDDKCRDCDCSFSGCEECSEECSECFGLVDADGYSRDVCVYAPTMCETCGSAPCDGSC